MSILPVNKETEVDVTPKTFLIWGESMSGKTFLAKQFPNPIIINTDGNAKKISTPSIECRDFETFTQAIYELETTKHTYETVIIDLVDDIEIMLVNLICRTAKVDALADIPFGKGFAKFNSTWKNLMMKLSQLPMNIIFISHIIKITDENDRTYDAPSLPQKSLNACQGRCDLVIQCRKIGTKYISTITAKREQYKTEDFKDKKIFNILKNTIGLVQNPMPVKTTPIIDGDIKLDPKPATAIGTSVTKDIINKLENKDKNSNTILGGK